MTLRIPVATALAVVAATVLAGSAVAIPTADDDEAGSGGSAESEVEWEVGESDPGIVCSPDGGTSSSLLDGSITTSSVRTSTTESLDADTGESGESADGGGDACATGAYRPSCKKVTVVVRKRTAFYLSVAFEWVVEKEWCWDYPRVTWWRVHAYPRQMDRFVYYRGIVGRFDRYFIACCFSTRSGHSSYRMGWFENCIPFKGCLGSWYPRVQIDVHGNGTYRVPVKAV